MATVLVIESSARQSGSVSRSLSADFIAHWQLANPQDQVIVRDVAGQPLPHLDQHLLGGWMKPVAEQSAQEQAADARSHALIAELQAADVLVIAAPMYNFGVPSTLKAWVDHVLRAGATFRYGEAGPVGLLSGKRAVLISARGGVYAGTPIDFVEPYLLQVLRFIGITEVECVRAEGLNMGEGVAAAGLAQARSSLQAIPV